MPRCTWLKRQTAAGGAALLDAGATMQVGFDLKPAAAAEPRPVDLQILHDSLHVVACLGERNLFDPVDGVDLGIAGIAVALDPFLGAAATGIIGGKGQDVGATVVLEQPAQFGGAKCCVIDRVQASRPASGVTCISPKACAGDTTAWLKALSCLAML